MTSAKAKPKTTSPHKFYDTPQDVLNDKSLSRDQKRAALRNMELDARLMQEAASENMTGGQSPTQLQDIYKSLNQLATAHTEAVNQTAPFAIDRIVVGLDTDDHLAEPIVRAALSVANLTDAEIRFLTIVPPAPLIATPAATLYALDAVSPIVFEHRMSQEAFELHKMRLIDIVAKTNWSGGLMHDVLAGAPDRTILDIAGEWSADLIVLGTHHRSWVERLVQSSASRQIIDEAPCAVLLLPESSVTKR